MAVAVLKQDEALEIIKKQAVTPNPLWLWSMLKIYTDFNTSYKYGLSQGAAGLSSSAMYAEGWKLYEKAVAENNLAGQLEIAAIIFNDRLKRLRDKFTFDEMNPPVNYLQLASIGYVAGEGNAFVNGVNKSDGNFDVYKNLNVDELEGSTFLKKSNISPTTGKGWEFAERVTKLYDEKKAEQEKLAEAPKKTSPWLWILGAAGVGLIIYASTKKK
ncbi:hypothetical protein JW935_05980 [candidate division KSB1 bacterium]|nr:hypothetical protein [candidate division KSB1 bacterium]